MLSHELPASQLNQGKQTARSKGTAAPKCKCNNLLGGFSFPSLVTNTQISQAAKKTLFWCNRVGRGFSSCFIRCHSEMQQGANSPQHSACEQRVYISICLGVDFIAAKFLFPFVLRVSIILTHRTSSYPIPKGFTGDHVISPNSLALWVAQVLARCAPCSCSLVSAEMPPAFHSSLDKPGLAHGFS